MLFNRAHKYLKDIYGRSNEFINLNYLCVNYDLNSLCAPVIYNTEHPALYALHIYTKILEG